MLAKAVRQVLTAWRVAKLSRAWLARVAGVPHTLLNRYAAGVPCTPRVARKLARALREHGA